MTLIKYLDWVEWGFSWVLVIIIGLFLLTIGMLAADIIITFMERTLNREEIIKRRERREERMRQKMGWLGPKEVKMAIAEQIVRRKQDEHIEKKEPPIKNLVVAQDYAPRVLYQGHTFKLGGQTYCDEVREYPPARRTLLFTPARSKAKVKPAYFVWFPYVIFVRKKTALYMAVARGQVQSVNDVVYFPPVGNVYASMKVCLHNAGLYHAPNFSFNLMVDYFWSAPADLNTRWTGRSAIDENFGSCEEWEKMDLEEVLDRVNYRPIKLRKLVGRDWNALLHSII